MPNIFAKLTAGAFFTLLPAISYAAGEGGAAAPNLAQMADGLSGQTGGLLQFLSIVAAVMGVVMAMAGLWKMRSHSNNPNDPSNSMGTAFLMIFAGAMMVALPALLGSGIATIWNDPDAARITQENTSYFGFR